MSIVWHDEIDRNELGHDAWGPSLDGGSICDIVESDVTRVVRLVIKQQRNVLLAGNENLHFRPSWASKVVRSVQVEAPACGRSTGHGPAMLTLTSNEACALVQVVRLAVLVVVGAKGRM